MVPPPPRVLFERATSHTHAFVPCSWLSALTGGSFHFHFGKSRSMALLCGRRCCPACARGGSARSGPQCAHRRGHADSRRSRVPGVIASAQSGVAMLSASPRSFSLGAPPPEPLLVVGSAPSNHTSARCVSTVAFGVNHRRRGSPFPASTTRGSAWTTRALHATATRCGRSASGNSIGNPKSSAAPQSCHSRSIVSARRFRGRRRQCVPGCWRRLVAASGEPPRTNHCPPKVRAQHASSVVPGTVVHPALRVDARRSPGCHAHSLSSARSIVGGFLRRAQSTARTISSFSRRFFSALASSTNTARSAACEPPICPGALRLPNSRGRGAQGIARLGGPIEPRLRMAVRRTADPFSFLAISVSVHGILDA